MKSMMLMAGLGALLSVAVLGGCECCPKTDKSAPAATCETCPMAKDASANCEACPMTKDSGSAKSAEAKPQ